MTEAHDPPVRGGVIPGLGLILAIELDEHHASLRTIALDACREPASHAGFDLHVLSFNETGLRFSRFDKLAASTVGTVSSFCRFIA